MTSEISTKDNVSTDKTKKVKKIAFRNEKGTNERVRNTLGLQLKKLKEIKEARILECYGNETLRFLGKEIKSLKKLHIQWERITGKELNMIGLRLRALRSLQSLNLNFQLSEGLSDQGLIDLSKRLRRLTGLQSIALDFSLCKKVSDRGLISLTESLKGVNSLQSISLDFSACYGVSDKSLKNISEFLKRQSLLKSLELEFNCCYDITDEAINNLGEALKGLNPLQYVKLNFGYSKVSDRVLLTLWNDLEALGTDVHVYCLQSDI